MVRAKASLRFAVAIAPHGGKVSVHGARERLVGQERVVTVHDL